MTTTQFICESPELALSNPGSVQDLVRELLCRLGENPEREGLEKTPERVARMYPELLAGYQTDLETLVNGAVFHTSNRDMVLVREIQYYSMCEHHLLPFFGKAHVAYIPDGRIIGLSKIPRLVEMYARRLQVQERMTHQIAEALFGILRPHGVAVLVEGAHLCAMMRGVRQSESHLMTSSMLGVFEQESALRNEFFNRLQLRAAKRED
ncbi:MAG: GTP cyclohydrolase I FolE [Anaerolineales bacterium]